MLAILYFEMRAVEQGGQKHQNTQTSLYGLQTVAPFADKTQTTQLSLALHMTLSRDSSHDLLS